MNSRRLSLLLFVLFLALTAPAFAQTLPNLENGFKYYGSHDGSNLDTVNLMNGNWMLHAPLFPDFVQRGALGAHYLLSVSSKNWQVACVPDTSAPTGRDCHWSAGGTGVVLDRSKSRPRWT